jgi:7-carboxy-7-deazaguanine synthase
MDELKFVISDKKDYDYSKEILNRFAPRCNVIFQPSYGVLKPETLAEWIINDRINVRLGMQLHKILWGDRRGV